MQEPQPVELGAEPAPPRVEWTDPFLVVFGDGRPVVPVRALD